MSEDIPYWKETINRFDLTEAEILTHMEQGFDLTMTYDGAKVEWRSNLCHHGTRDNWAVSAETATKVLSRNADKVIFKEGMDMRRFGHRLHGSYSMTYEWKRADLTEWDRTLRIREELKTMTIGVIFSR